MYNKYKYLPLWINGRSLTFIVSVNPDALKVRDMCSNHIGGTICLSAGGEKLKIHHSTALKRFKSEIGQANHMLITIMVGLDGIIPYDVEAQNEFHTSWNPKSKKASVERSKLFAKKATMAWLVDCLDMYLRLINQSPILISSEKLKQSIDSVDNSRSIYKRINLICQYYEIQSTDFALVDLLICWRNRLTHFQAENDISLSNRRILEQNIEKIKEKHCGLSIDETLISFDNCDFPTFKEITSFVRASINLVSELDRCLLDDIDLVTYSDRIIVDYLNTKKDIRLNNIFSKDSKTAEKNIRQILAQNGFTPLPPNAVDEFCKNVSNMDFQTAKTALKNGTFISS